MMPVSNLFELLLIITASLGLTAAQQPNVVLIVADDLGWNDVSFHGSRQIPTPNLDTLAYDGILLKNYYVQPICTPTRSALMTGRYPIHTGMQHSVIVASEPYGLPLNETLMSQYFKQLDYSTHIVGKWHLGFCANEYTPLYRGFDGHYGYYMGEEDYWSHIAGSPKQWHLGYHADPYTPLYRGFESHYGYYQGCGDYFDHTYTNDGPRGDPKAWGLDFRRDMDVINTAFGEYSTELFSREAENIIDKHDTKKPLFMYLPHQAVHSGNPFTKTPLEAPWKYQQKFSHIKDPNRRLFAAMVSALDDAVGNVTKALHRRGMLNNTIIVFTTDNGGPAAGFDFNFASNWPLRGLKSTLWEGGTRASGFMWSPLLETSGYISEQMVHVVDWLPTLLHPAGFDMSKLPGNLDGFDQWDTLSEKGTSGRTEFLYNIDPRQPSRAIRINNMKLIYGRDSTKEYNGWYKPEQTAKSDRKAVQDKFESIAKANDIKDHMDASVEDYPDLVDEYNSEVVDNERARKAFDYPTEPPENAPQRMFRSDLTEILRDIGRNPPLEGKPAVIECPNRPANYTTNCQVGKKACLFDIAADPCEFNNLADRFPDVVEHLTRHLVDYERSMVPPRNKPIDPKGLPYYHNGVWVPWLNLTHSERREMREERKP